MIMEAMMLKPGQVLTRDQLMAHARGQEGISFDRSIDMHISKLRAKIESISGEREMIKTVWGSGYMYVGDL
ncbi:MAG: Transcriptional regulatory protein OmpR [Deltaproteobacteria bacterium ADurb.Bin510]|nr:MAG: Transcriptional regulatory protein OmpR [Deltaproteobacteria bacterium ADurb.Bin510]